MIHIKNIIGTLILFVLFLCIQISTTLAVSPTPNPAGEKPVDITNYHKGNNPKVNLEDFGDFTPVESVGEFSSKTLTFLMSILGGIAMLGVIAGGIMIMGGGFSESTMENGKTLLLYSIIGVGVAMLSILIVTLAQSFLYSFGK